MSQTETQQQTGVKQGTQSLNLPDGQTVELQAYRRDVLLVAYPNTLGASYELPNGQTATFSGPHMVCINQISGPGGEVRFDVYGMSHEDFKAQSYSEVQNRPHVYQKTENIQIWQAAHSVEIPGRDSVTGQTGPIQFNAGDVFVRQPNGDQHKFTPDQMKDYYKAA
jgi:hypothetical protein